MLIQYTVNFLSLTVAKCVTWKLCRIDKHKFFTVTFYYHLCEVELLHVKCILVVAHRSMRFRGYSERCSVRVCVYFRA